MRDALGKAALAGRHPARQRARRGGKCGAFADTEQKPRQQQRHRAFDVSEHHRRGRPDRAADQQRQARPKLVAEPAARNLKECVRIGECGDRDAELGVAKPEILLHRRCCRRDVDPIDVGDQVHQADDEQDDIGCLEE